MNALFRINRTRSCLWTWCAGALVSFVVAPGHAAETPTQRAEAIVAALARSDFAAVAATADATLRSALPEPKLREAWQAVTTQAGRFQERLRSEAGRQQELDVVVVTCRMEKAVLAVRVVLNAQGQLAGLFFAPGQAEAPAAAAPPPAEVREEEITVGAEGWPLPGTLTLPAQAGSAPAPAVVLVHGSGPHDRDQTIGPNKPFRDLAIGLAQRGVAVLRYDKRTRVHGPRMAASLPQLSVEDEVLADARAAVVSLRARAGIDARRIFVIGHSLGGMLVPRLARQDPGLAGIVILAGPTRRLEDAIVEQTRLLLGLDGSISAEDEARLAPLVAGAAEVKALGAVGPVDGPPILGLPRSYWRDLNAYDPVAAAAAVGQRILVAHGARDYQVTMGEFEAWRAALQGRGNVTFKLYPRLNHLLIAGDGASTPDEYQRPGTVDAGLIEDLARWLREPAPERR